MIDAAPDTLPPCPFCGAQLVPMPYRKAGSTHPAMMHPVFTDCLLAGGSFHNDARFRARWSRRIAAPHLQKFLDDVATGPTIGDLVDPWVDETKRRAAALGGKVPA